MEFGENRWEIGNAGEHWCEAKEWSCDNKRISFKRVLQFFMERLIGTNWHFRVVFRSARPVSLLFAHFFYAPRVIIKNIFSRYPPFQISHQSASWPGSQHDSLELGLCHSPISILVVPAKSSLHIQCSSPRNCKSIFVINDYLQELLVLHKRHFWEVVLVVLSDDQVVLTQGLRCIKDSNPE